MGVGNIIQSGRSGMNAAKVQIATSGHNITNANTEGFSRQRVQTTPSEPSGRPYGKNRIGTGTMVGRVERLNDEYLEKQIRNNNRDMASFEERDVALKQVEDIFNEMGGDGLNRLISRFFNEFRKLSEEPENPAMREAVREASQAMVNDFKRLRHEVDEVRRHIDARIEGYTKEVNMLSEELTKLNTDIQKLELVGGPPNDLLDRRDLVMKKLGAFMDLQMHKDNKGRVIADVVRVGPLVAGPEPEQLSADRSPADGEGKPEGAFDVLTSSSAPGIITHQIKGGKLGALLETRDKSISTVLERLDDLAFSISSAVNEVHTQGFTNEGIQGVAFFAPLVDRTRAAEFLELSDDIKANVNNIAAAAIADAPGDNRIAIAISRIQNQRILNNGNATADEWYNSIVSDVGVAMSKNRFALNQQRDVMTQLNRMRDQISGVSIDEETANLLQFQHIFDASAKVVQVADEMLKTVLELKR